MHQTVCYDHLGNEFPSKKALCEHYHITASQFYTRTHNGWSLEDALTKRRGAKGTKSVYDHLGNRFDSVEQMCNHWGIADSTFQGRVARGMSVEKALTATHEDTHGEECYDHLGNKFPSTAKMCEHYGIPRQMYYGRIKCGWALEDILTKPKETIAKNSKAVTDHKGNKFVSVSEMCKHWNMTRSTFNARIKAGWSIEKALTEPKKPAPSKNIPQTDHLGNTFPSLNAMCQHWGISRTLYSSRIKNGWSVERALTTKELIINSIAVKDYKGREFPSTIDICNYYGAPEYMLQGKKHTENLLHKTYLYMFKPLKTIGRYTIIKQLTFPYFVVNKEGEEIICDIEELLQEYHNSDEFSPIPKRASLDKIEIIRCIDFPHYEVKVDGESQIWTYWQLIQYRRDNNYCLGKTT